MFRRFSSFALLRSLCAAVFFSAPSTFAGLVGQWSFDETGGTIANNSAGTVVGVLSTTGARFVTNGIAGGALRLDRLDQGFVSFGRDLPFTGPFSISVWIKTNPGDTSDSMAVYSKHITEFANGFWLNINKAGVLAEESKASFYQRDVFDLTTSATHVNDGNWHHIVIVHTPNAENCIYVDGISEDCDATTTLNLSDAPFLVGAFSTSSGGRTGFFNGLVDELTLYNHALSTAEVGALYANPGGEPMENNGISVTPRETLFTNSVTVTVSNLVGVGEIDSLRTAIRPRRLRRSMQVRSS